MRLTHSPSWAPHVVGEFDPRSYDEAHGDWEPQTIDLSCKVCGDTHRTVCSSGQPREKVAKYALVHLHRDPLSPLPEKP